MNLYLFGGGAPLIEAISVEPAAGTIAVGGELQLAAYADVSSNPSMEVTSSATWSSSDEGVATVDANGVVHGQAEGVATITATLGSVSGSMLVEIDGEASELIYFRHTVVAESADFSIPLPIELLDDAYAVKLSPTKGSYFPELEPVDEQSSDRTTTSFRVVASSPLQAGDQIDVLVMQ